MSTDDEVLAHTLYLCRDVQVYRIPPRPGAGGYRSGEWRVSDKIFDGRLRVVAKGAVCEILIEDPNSGDLFATCPITEGKREVCVEPVTDSSRYFVLRVEDPGTHRHAFLGMGFVERSNAFDFNVALVDFERQLQREMASEAAQTHAATSSHPNAADDAVAALYKEHGDLSLKDGQTIKINVKKPASGKVESRLTAAVPLMPLPPPPGAAPRLAPPPPAQPSMPHPPVMQAHAPHAPPGPVPAPASATDDLLGFGDFTSSTTQQLQQMNLSPGSTSTSTSSSNPGWATFD